MTAVTWVDPVLACGAILGALGFVGAGIGWAIQCHHTGLEADRARRAERLAERQFQRAAELFASNVRLRQLLERQADENAERLADLVSVVGTDTAEDPRQTARTN